MVCAGKSLAGLQFLSRIFHDRTLHKYYICLTKGKIEKPDHIRGYLHKDKKTNKVIVSRQEFKDSLPIETKYCPLGSNGKITLLEVELITGLETPNTEILNLISNTSAMESGISFSMHTG